MFGGYQWDGIDFGKINFGADQPVVVNYGGQDPCGLPQNFDGHGATGGHGVIDQMLDLQSDGTPQNFGGPVDEKTASEKNDRLKFERIIEVLDDLYSFEHAQQAIPALQAYFGIATSDGGNAQPPSVNIKNFLSPAGLERVGNGALVLGLPDLTLENPPGPVDYQNAHQVITPAALIEAFRAKDSFAPAERYHVRQNIVACLTALAELHRHRNDLSKIDTQALIMQVQQRRLKSAVDFQYERNATNTAMNAADKEAHVKELTRRTLARLQQGMDLKHAAPSFEALGLQRPGNAAALTLLRDIDAAGDEQYAEKFARLTLDQMADLLVETRPDWRLPLKTAIAGAVADYVGIEIPDATATQINYMRAALVAWTRGGLHMPTNLGMMLACIPSLGRETMLQMDPVTKEVKEVALKHADNLFLPSIVAKAIKSHRSNLENRVAGLIKNRRFYEEIYDGGRKLSTSLRLHGMYLQCSNPLNRNMAFQTPAQFNHPLYATRCSSGLYVNVTDPGNPRLECREAGELRLNYIDKLWSLFRVIMMDELEKNLTVKLAGHQAFLAETDPERKRGIASIILDSCVPETFDGAAGNLTGITRDILINAAMRNAVPDTQDMDL